MFSERIILYLTLCNEKYIYSPQCWANALDGINDHQMAAGKQLKNHDEQLMLIIPVVDRYNMRKYCDR
jgi:hypothetical protein